MRAEIILLASAAGFAIVFLLMAAINVAFYLRLKRFEHDTWVSLGSPMPVVNLDMSNFADVRKFLRNGTHKALSDTRAAKLGNLVVIADRVFLGYIAIAAICIGCVVLFVKP